MKTGFLFAILTAAILAVGCNPIYTSYDYDTDADFTNYKTFSWMEVPETVPQNAAEAERSNPLVAKHIRNGVNTQLTSKGLKLLEQGGDLLVIYYTDPKKMLLVQQTAYSGMDLWANSRMGGSTSTKEVTEGTIIFDLLEGETKQLVWRGTGENARNEDAPIEQIYDTIDKAIVKIFENYPPPK